MQMNKDHVSGSLLTRPQKEVYLAVITAFKSILRDLVFTAQSDKFVRVVRLIEQALISTPRPMELEANEVETLVNSVHMLRNIIKEFREEIPERAEIYDEIEDRLERLVLRYDLVPA